MGSTLQINFFFFGIYQLQRKCASCYTLVHAHYLIYQLFTCSVAAALS